MEKNVAIPRSAETGRSYRLDRLIGKGGFGEVYLATPTPAGGLPAQVCIKISTRLTAWLREAYFAELLEREPRALRIFDRFAEADGDGMRYCLVMEYAEHGDVGAWLKRRGPQPERVVRREIAALLGPLDVLHRGQALHRDLTPFNVFVCENEQLKLGDFGIARHQRDRQGVTADAFNPLNAPTEIAWGWVRRWQQRDDIYQVGQLAAMLLRGDIARPMRSKDVLKVGRVASLAGKRLSITGFLKRPRSEAFAAARRAGAIIQAKPGRTTDVLVRGRPNRLQIAGKDAGTKLMEIRRLAALGHRITIIKEQQFWKLAAPKTRTRRRKG